jgi:hypothetical protein
MLATPLQIASLVVLLGRGHITVGSSLRARTTRVRGRRLPSPRSSRAFSGVAIYVRMGGKRDRCPAIDGPDI